MRKQFLAFLNFQLLDGFSPVSDAIVEIFAADSIAQESSFLFLKKFLQ